MTGAPAPGARARALAARAVDGVVSGGTTLEVALARVLADAGLEPRDRAQVQALAYGALRGWYRYRRLAGDWRAPAARPPSPPLLALLAVGWFQLEADGPDYAAVSATVEAARLLGEPRAAGLVNALLRRYQRDGAAWRDQHAADPGVGAAHPAWLAAAIAADWPDAVGTVLAANQAHPDLWVRVNRRRADPADWAARLAAATGVTASGVPGLPDALRLAAPLPVEALPGFAAGEVSVQDGAAQLAAPLLAAQPGQRVLDACAAPGGKAAHLLERADDRLELVALDIDADRLARVRAGFARLGLAGGTAVVGDGLAPAGWWDGRPFDRILVDAPCSGTGVIRRHPDIKLLRRPDDIPRLAARQGELLDRLWPLLAPGGLLLYVTCSVLAAENAGVAAAFVARTPAARAVDPEAARPFGRPAGPGVQVLPGPGATDGFYYALMSRTRAPAGERQ
jgi:16S rRNA (cytosine967-C5)-methyltransferase